MQIIVVVRHIEAGHEVDMQRLHVTRGNGLHGKRKSKKWQILKLAYKRGKPWVLYFAWQGTVVIHMVGVEILAGDNPVFWAIAASP
jgi:hypothetical protein